jgi:CheY-like chemotaxis protein
MTARKRVLLAVGSDTLALRLRLMIEAEGGDVVILDGGAALPMAGIDVAVAVPAEVDEVLRSAPGVPVIEVRSGEDWEGLRRRLVRAMAPPPPAPLSEAALLGAALAKARILLVDDSVTYREFLRLELARLGAAVTVCSDPVKAMAMLGQGGWDCVLIDLVMPGMDGAQLCTLAAQSRRDRGGDYVLVVLSSREGKADLIRSLEAGADLFLSKSQDVAVIRAVLGAVLRRRLSRGVHESG